MSPLKSLVLAAALTTGGAASASAQAYYDPGYTLRMMAPVIMNPCPGDRCTSARTDPSRARPDTPADRTPPARTAPSELTATERAEATCVNARRMAAEGHTDPRLPQLIRLCAQRDHYAEQMRRQR